MKKIFQSIIDNRYILLVCLIVIVRFIFTIDVPNFYIKNLKIDDGLMINQMMTLSQRIIFRILLSKNTY
ncbi:MAG: hypothetical protein IKG56_03470 [Clostridia bacterium]|nr:hypothetical protein [Clostridia bacterium]